MAKVGDTGPAGSGSGDMLKSENLSGLANYTTARSNMGLVIGTDVQAYSATLAATTASFTTALKTNYDLAYGWGDHSTEGYLTDATMPADVIRDADVSASLLTDGSSGLTVVARDLAGDLGARYVYGNYISTDHTAASRTGDTVFYSSTDNLIRKNTLVGYLTSLGLENVENGADVTDATNVAAAGALMDSELTSIADVKALNQSVVTTASPTFVQPTVKAVIETRYAVTGTTPAIDPANGGIQTWTLSGNSTPTDSLGDGESVTLHIDDGTAYTITWTSLVDEWIGGTAPTLATTGYSVVELWKVNTTVYGVGLGDLS